MRSIYRFVAVSGALAAALILSGPPGALAQRGHRAPAPQHRGVHHDHVVFIGGYFYDPFFGPYPWWARADYPYPYYPTYYDNRAVLRRLVKSRSHAGELANLILETLRHWPASGGNEMEAG